MRKSYTLLAVSSKQSRGFNHAFMIFLSVMLLVTPFQQAWAEELKLKNIKTPLNLTLHNIPMDEALKAVASQAQFNIVLGDDLTHLVNLDFKDRKSVV